MEAVPLAKHAGLGGAVADNRVGTTAAILKVGAKPNVSDDKCWCPLCHKLPRASLDRRSAPPDNAERAALDAAPVIAAKLRVRSDVRVVVLTCIVRDSPISDWTYLCSAALTLHPITRSHWLPLFGHRCAQAFVDALTALAQIFPMMVSVLSKAIGCVFKAKVAVKS